MRKTKTIITKWIVYFMGTVILFGILMSACSEDKITSPTPTYSSKMEILWTYDTQGAVYSSPVLHDSIIYTGSDDGYLYALNAITGERIWRFNTGSKIRSTAAISDDLICIESGNQLFGIDMQGALVWSFPMCTGPGTQHFDMWDYFHSSPIIHDGIAYAGTEKGLVYGVNIVTGDEALKIQTSNTTYGIRTTPAIDNGNIFFGDWNGVFYCYDISTGQEIWSYDVYPERLWYGGVPAIQTHPVVFNGAVHFGGRGSILYALNVENGSKVWTHKSPTNQWLLGGPVIVDNKLYLGSSDQRIVHEIDALTGNVNWQTNVGDGRIFGAPLVNDSYVYVGTGNDSPNDGSLVTLDRVTGDIVTKLDVGNQVQSSPILNDGVIYFGCGNKKVYAINATPVQD